MKRRKSGKNDKKYLSILNFKNIHDGERCFIVATGPSLTVEDVEMLGNEISFGMNSIPLIFSKTNWRPTYYAIQDKYSYEKLKNNPYFQELNNKFIADFIKEECGNVEKDAIIYPLELFDHMYYKKSTPFFTSFSDDIYSIVYDGATITYSIMQIAVYMGFKEIYLLGCDCNYKGQKHHFEDYGTNEINIFDNPENRMILAYKTAKKYCDSHGIKIYNATRGGNLEIFERVKLEDICN